MDLASDRAGPGEVIILEDGQSSEFKYAMVDLFNPDAWNWSSAGVQLAVLRLLALPVVRHVELPDPRVHGDEGLGTQRLGDVAGEARFLPTRSLP